MPYLLVGMWQQFCVLTVASETQNHILWYQYTFMTNRIRLKATKALTEPEQDLQRYLGIQILFRTLIPTDITESKYYQVSEGYMWAMPLRAMVFRDWRRHNMPYSKQVRDRHNIEQNQQESITDRGKSNFSLVPVAYFQKCTYRHTHKYK